MSKPKTNSQFTRIVPRIVFLMALVCMLAASGVTSAQNPEEASQVGVDEKLGESVPLDLVFNDESGNKVKLEDLLDRPAVMALVYYRCPGICTPLLNGLTEVVGRADLEPGVDYRVLTVSFDPTETPEMAASKKLNYMGTLQGMGRDISASGWRFLTADKETIAKLTDSVGFRYKPDGKDYLHPGVLVVLSPEGKIARYLFGLTYLPFDLKMAVAEAAAGRTGPTVNKVLRFCFAYDPEGRTYVFNITKVVGSVMILFAVTVFGYLSLSGRARARKTK